MPETDARTIDLLRQIVGLKKAKRLYQGLLGPIFDPKDARSDDHAPLLAARELVRRWLEEELRHQPVLTSPQNVSDYLKLHFAGKEQEIFAALFLDNRHRLIATENLFYGTIDGSSVHPREVVKRALEHNCAAVIVTHNHPSGVSEPSQADELITCRLKEALALVDIRLLDHVVVGCATVTSFAERGLL